MLNFKVNKRFKGTILVLLISVILLFSFGSAFAESYSGENIVLEADTTLNKTSFFSGQNIRIDGNINATTFASGLSVQVNGDIDGDLFLAGQDIIINGNVTGSVFSASQNVTINGDVGNNIYFAGATLKVQSKVDGSAFLAGQNAYLEDKANIGKDAFIGASSAYQNGIINGDLYSGSNYLFVGGKIGGDLNYESSKKADFGNDSEVVGKTNWEETKTEPQSQPSRYNLTSGMIWRVVLSLLASLLIWLAIRLIRPGFWIVLAEGISRSPLKTLGVGAAALVLVPIVSILAMFTFIAIPLSIITLMLYVITIYISKIIFAVFISYWLQRRFDWPNAAAIVLFLLSMIILYGLGLVPIVGTTLSFFIAAFGLGSIILSVRKPHNKGNLDNL